jgi:hypothetical protein
MTTKPIRIQLSRRKGWQMPPNTVKVSRPGPYGNPYKVTKVKISADVKWAVEAGAGFRFFDTKEDAQSAAVELFKTTRIAELISRAPGSLRGRNLACWCKIDEPCHADVLLELANEKGGAQ